MSVRQLAAIATLTLVASLAALAGCGGADPDSASARASTSGPVPAAAPASKWKHGYPNSITVLGHSMSTGEESDPRRPGVEVRSNSWVTGSNPAVDSLYRRILKRNPAIRGHNKPYSEGGANIDRVALQADRMLATKTKPELIVIQVMDNDLICPLDSVAVSGFQAKLTAMLKKLAAGAPNSREFVVSQFGSPGTWAESLTQKQREAMGGAGVCSFVAPGGTIAKAGLARIERAIHAYEAALKAACHTVRQCTYDGGAFGSIVDKRRYVGRDLNHLSVKGHAKAAEVAWKAMRRAHVVPRR
jgi:hypothetical protein